MKHIQQDHKCSSLARSRNTCGTMRLRGAYYYTYITLINCTYTPIVYHHANTHGYLLPRNCNTQHTTMQTHPFIIVQTYAHQFLRKHIHTLLFPTQNHTVLVYPTAKTHPSYSPGKNTHPSIPNTQTHPSILHAKTHPSIPQLLPQEFLTIQYG